jgi:glyoxylase-like metal-dependent hydrolase (beta-lactamase superfamily II)
MKWSIKMIPTATIDVPSPEVYWMESFHEWTTLQFQVGILRYDKNIILINTGFPDDVSGIAKAWKDFLGERAVLQRPDAGRMSAILEAENIKPEDVTHVIITPIQLYATGNLHLFKNAKICFSRKGWIEDIIAPVYPHHVPRQGCISDEHLNWLMNSNHENLLLMDDIHELLPALTCRWIGVHHRSSILIELKTEQGIIGISDCAFHYSNIEDNRPLGIAESIIEAHAAYQYIRTHLKTFIPLYDRLVQERHSGGVVLDK